MGTILSCGHREDNEDKHHSIMTKEWSRENTHAVGYKTVCLYCYDQHEKHGELLYTDKEAREWIK